ncbi:NADPH-dependent FMN reductase [Psychromicrobium lacuslunae]|uniref:NADPH-dependent FMN reductase n=1 Tax=Psychromicrobium lacuslunae TaxID=1618207 RepID=A0A0D4C143_9MICC|nr:NAD(P)H-dependent oxidoreductase [Psychromicrobium lacuslunae]AJT42313.1 NADPH-dependent FMN reductase [Psychromicrobium lacuslunae]
MTTSPLKLPVISTSLDPQSRSRRLADLAAQQFRQLGHHSELIDLSELKLGFFDNHEIFTSQQYQTLHEVVSSADAIAIAAPVYNWSLGASAKNFIEATGATDSDRKAAWFDKVVTFLCAGGLPHSYMAFTELAASMMLDFKCVINPYMVYTTERDWQESGDLTPERAARLAKTSVVHAELAERLSSRSYSSDWEI